ncbi:putative disease resistance protein RGA3 [Telopea speciosissima]|uniref:putative disease resistance protein RGA3 n=1 Tax=Telopea speciosissima TaxID=54955 RepID=UPI001CC746EC|nr:putative disease resistance protein RGA3 [Telopea speciosissima]
MSISVTSDSDRWICSLSKNGFLDIGQQEVEILKSIEHELDQAEELGVHLQDIFASCLLKKKMAMRDYAAGKELISTTLGRLRIHKEYTKLQDTVSETKVILMDLERRHLQGEEDVAARIWLKEIKELYYEADDLLDEFSYGAMGIQMEIQNWMRTRKVSINSLSVLSYPLLFSCRMSRKIKDFQNVLDELKREIKFPDSREAENHEINEIDRLPTANIDDTLVYGRDAEEEKIANMLIDPNNEEMLSIISMVGIGGVGKTTLAQQIFNDGSIRSHFDLRFWVYVSSEFDVKRVVKEIIELSGRSTGDLTNWDNLQHISEEILSGKRFLLVLKDVQPTVDKEKWDNFITLLRVGSKGSKIMVTTQSHEVALIMGTLPPFFLLGLSEEESWALFRRKAFGRGGAVESPDLVRIGLELVKECRGLPLALKTLGAMMQYKTDIEEWTTVLNTMKALRSNINKDISTLIICYNDMKSPWKRCFLYCSVFPANFLIGKKKLIQLWMAEGFLEEEASSNGDVISLEDIGNAYFNSLVLRCFLQVVKMDDKGEPLECRMLNTVHYFARIVLGNEVKIVQNVDKVEPDRETRYLSFFVRSDTESIPDKFYTMIMNKVRTWLNCSNNISPVQLLKFKRLRVLELRHISKDELPSSIGELMHLRYLDLSYGRFKELPSSISKLYYLQTLKLLHCRYLQRLPKGMTKLINLRHLEIERSLNTPRGLGQLRNLQTCFTVFKLGNSVTTEAGIEELGCLQQLGGSLSLIGLGNVKNGADAKAAKLNEKRRLQELTLEWESDLHVCTEEDSRKQDVVLEELQPHHQNLFLLKILRFSGTKLPTWLNGSSHLSNLRELCIYSCHHVKSLDLTGLRSLRELMISYCENLEYARVEGLMALELLEFKGCDKLKSLGAKGANQEEQVGSSQEEHVHNIPNLVKLVKLRIQSCDRLTTLPEKEMLLLQSLKTLHIDICANRMVLTKGLENLSLLQHLQIENCSNLEALPEGLRQISSLQHFAIRECPKLESLSEEIQHWRSLQKLGIFTCANLRDLPRDIAKLTSLQELEINGCDCLISFPDETQELMSLKMLKIEQCSNLRALPEGLGKLSSLEVLEISSCNRLTSLPGGMQHLTSLDTLKIKGCDNLKRLPEEFGNPSTLRVLAIIGCPNLQVLPEGLGNLQNLRLLEITDCSNLTALPDGLGELSSLRSLYIQRCVNLTSFPDTLLRMRSLRVLWLIECPKLKDLSSGLRSLSALEKLTIWGCHNLIKLFPGEDFWGIQALNSLQELTISHCSKLETLPYGLEKLQSLKELVIWNCPELESFENVIAQLKEGKLRKLNIKDCPCLETMDDASYSHFNSVLTPPGYRFIFSYVKLISKQC